MISNDEPAYSLIDILIVTEKIIMSLQLIQYVAQPETETTIVSWLVSMELWCIEQIKPIRSIRVTNCLVMV